MHRFKKTLIYLALLTGFCLSLFGDPVHLSRSNHSSCQMCSTCLIAEHLDQHHQCQHHHDSSKCNKCKNTYSFRGHKLTDRDASEIFVFTVTLLAIDLAEPCHHLIPLSWEGSTNLEIPPLLPKRLNSPSGLRAPPVFC